MQSSSNPAFKNMEKVIGAQQQAAPSAEYLDQMYQQPAYQAPARERFLTVDDVVTKTASSWFWPSSPASPPPTSRPTTWRCRPRSSASCCPWSSSSSGRSARR